MQSNNNFHSIQLHRSDVLMLNRSLNTFASIGMSGRCGFSNMENQLALNIALDILEKNNAFKDGEEEIWKDVVGHEHNYMVSNMGRVKSKTRVNQSDRWGHCTFIGKVFKHKIDKDGYPHVGLRTNKIKKYPPIHRLVATAFIPNPENKKTVNHKNGIKTDNRVVNLEWATHQENTAHAYATKLLVGVSRFGADNWVSKKVVNTKTGVIFNSIKEAHIEYGKLSRATFELYLNGKRKNKTIYMRLDKMDSSNASAASEE